MDLFQKLGLRLLSWEENIKVFKEEENKSKGLKEGILKNNEHVLLLETKQLNELTLDNFIRIHHFLINQPFNFVNLEYLLIKDDKDMFFAYQKIGPSLMEYLEKSDLNLEMRMLIFKQAVEIVYYLNCIRENFLHFDFNFFFVEISAINSTRKLPILKLIPHCDFFNKAKYQNSTEFASKNYFYWLFYLQFLIFKENPNTLDPHGNHKEYKPITEDIKLLANILIEIISDNNSKNLTIENIIDFINCILKKCHIREISLEMKHDTYYQKTLNSDLRNYTNYATNNNIPINYNYFGLNKHGIPHEYNPNLYNMNNLHNIGNVNIPGMNISNNINNSQINYHQYFQFFQNNHSNYNNISYIPNENFAMFMDQPNPQLAHKLIYNNPQGNIQNFFNPNINGMMTSLGNNYNSKLNKSLQNPNFFNELSLLNNNPFYQSNFNNAMTSTNINNMSNINSPVFSLEMIKNINDSSNLTNNNSFYQIKNLNMINELLNSNNTQDMKPPQYVLNNNYTKGIVPSKDNGDHIISKSNSSIVTTNNVNNSSSNVMFSVENFLNDKQEKPQSQSLIDKSTKVKKFNCENDSIIIIHEINCIPIRFDIVVDKKILKNYNNDSSKVNNEINLSIDCNYLNKFSPDKSEYVIDNKNSILNGNLSDEEKTILKNKRPRGINDDQEKYNINSSKQNSDNKKEDIQNNNNKIRKIKRYVPNERYSYFDDYNDNNYNCANYKSSLLTYHNFDEKDLEMINSIDNPRRKKNKHKKNNEADKKHFFTTENNQHLINQFNNYLPIFEEELNEHLKCKSHQFMKENFPEMYNIENFYLHVKMIKEKREKKLRSLVIQINQIEITSEGNVKESSFQSDNEFKMVWDCKRLNGTEVDNFLFLVEKQWPLNDYIWSQESALEFLSINDYDIDKTVKTINEITDTFKQFLDSKRLNRQYHRTNVKFENDKVSKRRIRYKKS